LHFGVESPFTLSDITATVPRTLTYAGLPRRGVIFRTHPEHEIQAYVLYSKGQWYLFKAGLIDEVKKTVPFLHGVYNANLHQAIDSEAAEFVVLISLGGSGDGLMEFIEASKSVWMERLDSDESVFQARPDYAARTPHRSIDFDKLLNAAFKGKYIADASHPVLKAILDK
jgi:hypothetical protein